MGLLVVGSIALDSVSTPFGQTADTLGGSAVYFAVAGAVLHPVQVVGVVGSDFPFAEPRSRRRSAPRSSCSWATSIPSCSSACSIR